MAANYNSKRPFKTTSMFYRKVKRQITLKKVIVNNKNHYCEGLKSVKYIDEVAQSNIVSSTLNFQAHQISQSFESNIDYKNNDDNQLKTTPNKECNENISDSEISESDEDCDRKLSLMEKLRNWSLNFCVPHRAVNELLKILSVDYPFLPKDSRTLLETPSSIDIVKMDSGEYWKNSLAAGLKSMFIDLKTSINITLRFNIDGLPAYGSSNIELWPILCAIDEFPEKGILTAGVYCGPKKPRIQNYLSYFVDEMLILLKEGLNINGHQINVSIKCFICDTVARSFIKGIAHDASLMFLNFYYIFSYFSRYCQL